MSVRRAQDERIEGTPDGNSAITAIMDVPDAPTIGTATDAGTGTSASVTFTAAVTGGTPTSYTVTSSPGNISGTGASSPVTVTGLTAGTAYTFTVTATNSNGTGAASAASNSVTLAVPPSFYSIATITGTGSSGIITFTSIPSTYTHLQVRIMAKDGGSQGDTVLSQFNSDTGANYTYHILRGSGNGTVATSAGANTSYFYSVFANGLHAFSPSVCIMDIHNYTSTSKFKTVSMFQGKDVNAASGMVALSSGLWRSTSAITEIKFYTETNTSKFSTSTTFALYGIKGS